MGTERLFTALVFCEAPLDGYGTSVLTAGAINRLVSGGRGVTKPAVTSKADAQKEQPSRGLLNGKSMAQRRPAFKLVFDGVKCFDTVVMH